MPCVVEPARTGRLESTCKLLGCSCLALNTIKAYNKNLYRKLGVNSREDAVAVARQPGLI
jgi:regulatory LuxR family protein